MRKHGVYQDMAHDKDHDQVVKEFNRWSDVVEFTVVTAGTEVAIGHGLDAVPSLCVPAVTASVTGDGVITPGSTAWSVTTAYLTATETGVYAVIFRR